MDDVTLLQQSAHRDAGAFSRLVERYQRRVLRFAERMLGDADAAQDVAQETFLRLWRSRCQVQGDLGFYLLKITRNLCLDYFRSHHKTEMLDEMTEAPSPAETGVADTVQSRALADLVLQSVQALPEAQRVVFILSHYEGMSYQEIAEVVGCPVGTVASRKYQAVETLRRKLRPWVEGEAR